MILCIIFPVLLIMVHQKPSSIVKAHRPILGPGETCRMWTHFFFLNNNTHEIESCSST